MIGNDVVDLKEALVQSDWKRKGFLEKVFSAPEREIINATADKDKMVWLLWSMKEAAYKAHQRKFKLPRNVNWLAQKCELKDLWKSGANGIVSIEREEYVTFSEIIPEALSTSAVENDFFLIKNELFQLSSEGVRNKLIQEVSVFFDVPSGEVSIKKDRHGIPYLSHNNIPFFSLFSLSHHGRFAAFSLPLMYC